MAKFEYKYADLKERKTQVEKAEGLGLRMVYDNFDPDWKIGDEPHGTMNFSDESLPPPPVISDSLDVITIKAYLANPNSGLPDLDTAVQALAREFLARLR